jgi:hypothetical protein
LVFDFAPPPLCKDNEAKNDRLNEWLAVTVTAYIGNPCLVERPLKISVGDRT